MGRMYTAEFGAVAITVAQDVFEISPADDKPVLIHAIFLSQDTELGDAAEDQLVIKIIRGHTTSGSGGGSYTPIALDSNDAAAGAAVEINNTTIASAGTAVDLHVETFNLRVGWVYMPTPEMRPRADQGDTTILVRLVDAPDDEITAYGAIYFEEL